MAGVLLFKASGAVPRLLRTRFHRGLFKPTCCNNIGRPLRHRDMRPMRKDHHQKCCNCRSACRVWTSSGPGLEMGPTGAEGNEWKGTTGIHASQCGSNRQLRSPLCTLWHWRKACPGDTPESQSNLANQVSERIGPGSMSIPLRGIPQDTLSPRNTIDEDRALGQVLTACVLPLVPVPLNGCASKLEQEVSKLLQKGAPNKSCRVKESRLPTPGEKRQVPSGRVRFF